MEFVPRWLAGTTVILVGDDLLRLPVSNDGQVSIQVEEGPDDVVTFVGQWTAPPLFTGSTTPIPLTNLAAAAAAPRSGLLRCQTTPGGVEIRMTVYLEGLSRHGFLDALGEVGRSYEFLVSAAQEFESQLQLLQDVRSGHPPESGSVGLPAPPAPSPGPPPFRPPQPGPPPGPPPFQPPQPGPPPGPPPFQAPQAAPAPSFRPPPFVPPPPQYPPYQPPQTPPYQTPAPQPPSPQPPSPQPPLPPPGPPPAAQPPPQPPAGSGWAASHRIAPGGADARDAPDPGRPVVVHLPDGMDVAVLERRYGWAHVAAQSGWSGWIAEYGVIAKA